MVLVGAASKGIIQRDFQHNATVYKSAYQRNPFEGITEEVGRSSPPPYIPALHCYSTVPTRKAQLPAQPVSSTIPSKFSPQELAEYRALIERKMRGEHIEDDIPENLRPLLQEPIAQVAVLSSTPLKSQTMTSSHSVTHKSPVQSPLSEEGECSGLFHVEQPFPIRFPAMT